MVRYHPTTIDFDSWQQILIPGHNFDPIGLKIYMRTQISKVRGVFKVYFCEILIILAYNVSEVLHEVTVVSRSVRAYVCTMVLVRVRVRM